MRVRACMCVLGRWGWMVQLGVKGKLPAKVQRGDGKLTDKYTVQHTFVFLFFLKFFLLSGPK